jgi:hypothetical protein
MIAKLVVEGKEFDIEILDPKLQELITPKKKTGYERVRENNYYWTVDTQSNTYCLTESNDSGDENLYNSANYYESEVVAGRNARADTLMRQLRRFAVEHRVNNINWEDHNQVKCSIAYGHAKGDLIIDEAGSVHSHGVVYFDRIIDAEAAIEAFRDELIWYFTEYKDSL